MDRTGQRGRPRVRLQIEQADPEILAMAEALDAVPKRGRPGLVVDTEPKRYLLAKNDLSGFFEILAGNSR